jgi:CRP-like cAMP-binding protein
MAEDKKVFAVGKELFFDGDWANSLFFIKKGAVSIRKKQGADSVEVGKAIADQVIGELSFFGERKRNETAVALSYVEAIEVSYDEVDKIYANVPPYMKTIMASMASRLQAANELIQKLQGIPK